MNWSRLVLMFVFGAILGGLGDYSHILTSTDGYPDSNLMVLPGQPFWVPFLFGFASVAIAISHVVSDRVLGPKNRKFNRLSTATAGGIAFLLLYLASGIFSFKFNWMMDVFLFVGALALWLALDRTWQGALLAIGTAITGTLFEINLVQNSIFYYTPNLQDLWGVPSWLPILYLSASLGVGHFARSFFSQKQELRELR